MLKWLTKKYSAQSEAGFALPLVIGLGLLMTIVALTMIMRGKDDRVNASAQKASSNSLTSAEVGINRVINFLNLNRTIAMYPYRSTTSYDWEDIINNPNLQSKLLGGNCTGGNTTSASYTELKDYVAGGWLGINQNLQEGQYKVIDYYYNQVQGVAQAKTGEILGNGVLKLQGRFNATSTNNNQNKSLTTALTYISVTIPITKTRPDLVPLAGVNVNQPTVSGNNQFAADFVVFNCQTPSTSILSDPTKYKVIGAPSLGLPSLPPIPTSGMNNLGIISSQGQNVVSSTAGTIPTNGPNNVHLPRVGDAPSGTDASGRPIYRYLVTSVDVGSKALVIDNVGKKVIFYLQGNIEPMTGNGGITLLDTTTPANILNFQVYGYGGPGSYMCWSGTSQATGFVLAPNYNAGINGGGSQPYVIQGFMWINSFGGAQGCSSNSNQIVVKQPDGLTWNDITAIETDVSTSFAPKDLPPTINAITDWKRLEVTP